MAEITFIFHGEHIKSLCQKDESMANIVKRSLLKSELELTNYYMLYSGNKIQENLTFNDLANEEDNKANKMQILVYSNDENNEDKKLEKSKDIICPECGEKSIINIKDYKIYFDECKNGHKLNDITLDEFECLQIIDLSKIKCHNCTHNKSTSFQNYFYKCLTCNQNFCPLCENIHNREHDDIIEYDKIGYICNFHNIIYTSFCKECKDNLCMFCESEHKDKENIIYYRDNLPKIDLMSNQIKDLKIGIDKLKEKFKEIKAILDKIIEKMEIYYNINENIMKSYKKKI